MVNTGLLDHLAKIKQLFLQALLWRVYLINTHSEVLFLKLNTRYLKVSYVQFFSSILLALNLPSRAYY